MPTGSALTSRMEDKSLLDKWKNPKARVSWKEISHSVDELGLLVKEKKYAMRKSMMVSEPESRKQ